MIQTRRLLIRPFATQDSPELAKILTHPVTMGFWPKPFSPEDVRGWLERCMESYAKNGFGRYALVLKDSGQLIGDAGLLSAEIDGEQRVDLGYIIHAASWGQGLGTEAAAAIQNFAFHRLRLKEICANMAHDHPASQRVAEKIGMIKIGEFINAKNRNLRTFLYQSVASTEPVQ